MATERNKQQTSPVLSTIGLSNSVSKRVLVYVLLASSLITCIITSVQLYLDYHEDVGRLENSVHLVMAAHGEALEYSLWTYNRTQIQRILQGIIAASDVNYVQIINNKGDVLEQYGKRITENSLESNRTMFKDLQGTKHQLGTIQFQTSLQPAIDRLFHRLNYVLIGQALKTFLVSIVILWILQRLVIRHLHTLADYCAQLDMKHQPPLLQPYGGLHNDELDVLYREIINMAQRQNSLFNELNETQKGLEQQVARRTQQLSESLLHNENLLRTLCHDIGNRQLSASLSLEEVTNKISHPSTQALGQHLKVIGAIVGHIQLLHRSSGKKMVRRSVHLQALVEDVLVDHCDYLEAKAIVLDLQPGPDLYVFSNAMSLQYQVLGNIFENCIKFSPVGSPLTVSIARDKKSWGAITIRDHGIGMPKGLVELLGSNEPVVSRTGTGGETGSGFGLAIARHFAYSLGAKLEISSPGEGLGTVVTLRLPLADDDL